MKSIGRHGFWIWSAVISAAIVAGTWYFQCELQFEAQTSLSAVVRNVALVWGGLIGLGLAVWRSSVAARQAETARQRIALEQEAMLRDRFQSAATMLGHNAVSVRIGGIQALFYLAVQNHEAYFSPVWHILESHKLCGSDSLEEQQVGVKISN